ncbi:MAG: hypothetical protein QXR45_09310 [Candidatus Bathyarchaeia archaeon]
MYKLIYFFGPDGVGKTTHANLIKDRLRLMGFRVWRASVKQHHTLAYLLLKTLSRANPKWKIINYYGFNDALMRRIRTPWKILEIVSLFPAVFYRVILPLLLGYVVVCDRYVLDTLVVLSYFLKDSKLISGVYAKLMVKLIPRDAILFYLNAETDVILQRKRDEPLTIHLIEYYRRAYETIMEQLRAQGLVVTRLNTTTTSIKAVHEIVHEIVLGYSKLGIRYF